MLRSSVKTLFLITIGLSVFLVACSPKSSTEQPPQVHQESVDVSQAKAVAPVTLPSFQLITEQGTTMQLDHLKGKKVFVNLWASWCPPCRAELPSIQKLYGSVDTGKVAFVLISLDKNFEVARRFKKFEHLKLPIFYPAEDLPKLFDVQSIPNTFIFDENGVLVQQVEGGDDYNQDVYKRMLQP